MRWLRSRWGHVLGGAAAVLVGIPLVAFVFFAITAKPYSIPSSGMEPTLHCARPATGCLSGAKDRVLVW
jgi:signal peptidase I